MSVTFLSGDISLMNNYDDLSPAIIRSGLKGIHNVLYMFYVDMFYCDSDHTDSIDHIIHNL